MKFTSQTLALFVASALTTSNASNLCKENGAPLPVITVSVVAPDTAGLTDGFENYRSLLGGDNNGNAPGPLDDGHRQINWDAAIVPFDMPGDFFEFRGLTLSSDGDEFRVSNPDPDVEPNLGIHDDLFDSINRNAAEDFSTFSPERLFTVEGGDNEFVAEFTVPGSSDPAVVKGFGAVFVDIDEPRKTTMTFYAESGCIIAEREVEEFKDGLSFLGLISVSEDYPIAKVEVELGTKALDGGNVRGRKDFVVMDDFLFSEPQGTD